MMSVHIIHCSVSIQFRAFFFLFLAALSFSLSASSQQLELSSYWTSSVLLPPSALCRKQTAGGNWLSCSFFVIFLLFFCTSSHYQPALHTKLGVYMLMMDGKKVAIE